MCKDHNGQRTGPRGFHLPDCTPETYPVSIEVKDRKSGIPQYVDDWLEQSVDECYDGYIPIVVWCEVGRVMEDNVVIMPYWAWRRLWDEYIMRRLGSNVLGEEPNSG